MLLSREFESSKVGDLGHLTPETMGHQTPETGHLTPETFHVEKIHPPKTWKFPWVIETDGSKRQVLEAEVIGGEASQHETSEMFNKNLYSLHP